MHFDVVATGTGNYVKRITIVKCRKLTDVFVVSAQNRRVSGKAADASSRTRSHACPSFSSRTFLVLIQCVHEQHNQAGHAQSFSIIQAQQSAAVFGYLCFQNFLSMTNLHEK